MRIENHRLRAFFLVSSKAEVENKVLVSQKLEILVGDGVVSEVVVALKKYVLNFLIEKKNYVKI